jgi:cobalt-zinc-cadmium efflux system protein
LGFAALLTGLFMVVEVVGGVLSGSLALLADAGHMLTDFAALFMAWAAFAIMGRGPTSRLSFGWGRLSILVAFVNGLTLFAVAGWIVFEAYHRLLNPGEVLGGPMLLVAIAGLFVNIAVLLILLGGDRENLNMRGAILHVMGDMLGSLAAIIAAVIILQTGFMLADPILSVLVALLILRSAWGLVRETGLILMEGVPRGVEVEAVRADLSEHVEGLSELTDIHSWAITPDQPMATVLAVAEEGKDRDVLRAAIKSRLAERFGVRHAIVEVSGG